jgi:predicted ATPase
MMAETNWVVITGGPSSGKTTTVDILRQRGFRTTIEHARHYIDTLRVTGLSVAEIRANQTAFQRGVMEMQIEQEQVIAPHDRVFLDRALPDGIAYHRFLGLDVPEAYRTVVRPNVYDAVFVLDLLPLQADYARTEDRAAQVTIHRLLVEVYSELGYRPRRVPPLPPEERVDFILSALGMADRPAAPDLRTVL